MFFLIWGTITMQLNDCPCGEMDIIPVFGTDVPGSNPGGGTIKAFIKRLLWCSQIGACAPIVKDSNGVALFCEHAKQRTSA